MTQIKYFTVLQNINRLIMIVLMGKLLVPGHQGHYHLSAWHNSRKSISSERGGGGGLLAGGRKLWGGGQQQIITSPQNIDKNIIFPGFHLTALIKYRKYDKKMFYGYKNKTSQS